jgi:hypothetical protein
VSFWENFDASLGNYVPDVGGGGTAEIDDTTGNPSADCVKLFSSYIDPTYSPAAILNNVDTYLVGAGEHFYLNARFLVSGVSSWYWANQIFTIQIYFADATLLYQHYYGGSLVPDLADSGWLQFDFDLTSRVGKTINQIIIGLLCHSVYNSQDGQQITAYLDSVSVGTSAPPFDPNPPPPGPRFYQGLNGLSYRSNLPAGIDGIEVAGMAVYGDGRVAIGSQNANSIMIAQASPDNNYASWTDLTDSHSLLSGVKALRRVE